MQAGAASKQPEPRAKQRLHGGGSSAQPIIPLRTKRCRQDGGSGQEPAEKVQKGKCLKKNHPKKIPGKVPA